MAGRARPHDVMHHVHEIAVGDVGSRCSSWPPAPSLRASCSWACSSATAMTSSGAGRCSSAPTTTSSTTCTRSRRVIVWLPTVMMAIGFALAWQFYIRRPDIPGKLATQFDLLYRFLLNKWYFDEIYDFLFVRPALRLGRSCGSGATGRSSTALALTASRHGSSRRAAGWSGSRPDICTTTPLPC